MRPQPYPQYYDRSIPLHPVIPAHWDARKATRVFDRIGSGTTPSRVVDAYYDGDIPWVTTSELREAVIDTTTERVTQLALEQNSALCVYQPGAVVIAMYGATIGRLGILGCHAAVNQACCVFDNSSLMGNRYFYYWLWSYRPILISLSAGGGQPNLNQEDLRSLRVPIPPLDEQSAIVRFLDAKTAEIDALLAKKRRLLDLLAEQRAALITRAVTKGLNPAARMKPSGLPWLGDIPAHWEIVQLRHIIRSGTTITYGIIQAGPDTEGGIPYIRTSDMAGDELPLDGYLRTTPEIDASYHRSKVSVGDVVVAIRATIGKPLMVPSALEGANLTQGTARIAPGSRVTAEYLCLFLRSVGATQEFDRLAKGATFKEITLEMLRKFPLALPPVAEQRAIVEAVSASRGSNARAAILQQIASLHEYRTALISAAVTGQIDVRNWSAKRAAA